jgi:cell shape-determining protein MreC
MKTNFLPKNNFRNNRNRPASFVQRALVVVIVFAVAAAVFLGGRAYINRGLAPVWLARSGAVNTGRGFLGLFGEKGTLVQENTDLKQRVVDDEEIILSLRAVASSYDELLTEFGRSVASGTPATVLSRPPETPYDTLVIDAGNNVGVKEGGTVVLPSGIKIGTVASVSDTTSTVLLYSSSGVITSAVLERGNIPVELHGRGGGNVEFEVPRNTIVVAGDRILSASLDASLIAVVGEADAAATDALLTVLGSSPLNLSTLRSVLVR